MLWFSPAEPSLCDSHFLTSRGPLQQITTYSTVSIDSIKQFTQWRVSCLFCCKNTVRCRQWVRNNRIHLTYLILLRLPCSRCIACVTAQAVNTSRKHEAFSSGSIDEGYYTIGVGEPSAHTWVPHRPLPGTRFTVSTQRRVNNQRNNTLHQTSVKSDQM